MDPERRRFLGAAATTLAAAHLGTLGTVNANDGGGNGMVVESRLYQLIRQPKPIVDRQLEIEFLDAGVEAFAFTFG